MNSARRCSEQAIPSASSRRGAQTLTPNAIIVYPRVHEIAELGFPALQPFGETRVAHHLLTDPARVVGIRDYRPEDPFRGIHWKATARMMRLQVKVEEPVTAPQLGIFVNLDTFDHYWEGLDVEVAEQAIEVAASIAVWADRHAMRRGCTQMALSLVRIRRCEWRRGVVQPKCPVFWKALAKLTPYSTVNFARVLSIETHRFPWGSTWSS